MQPVVEAGGGGGRGLVTSAVGAIAVPRCVPGPRFMCGSRRYRVAGGRACTYTFCLHFLFYVHTCFCSRLSVSYSAHRSPRARGLGSLSAHPPPGTRCLVGFLLANEFRYIWANFILSIHRSRQKAADHPAKQQRCRRCLEWRTRRLRVRSPRSTRARTHLCTPRRRERRRCRLSWRGR